MTQTAIDEAHAAQILAGSAGRDLGHGFEADVVTAINILGREPFAPTEDQRHIVTGFPGVEALAFVCRDLGLRRIDRAAAWWVGGLATSGSGDRTVGSRRVRVDKSKSDVVIEVAYGNRTELRGVSIKKCGAPRPTNAQMYLATASSFCALLRGRGIAVSQGAEDALRGFCGDPGFRPSDAGGRADRLVDTRRWFWEEMPAAAFDEWGRILGDNQPLVTDTLLRAAYPGDPIPPDYLMHQRYGVVPGMEGRTPLAIFRIEQLVRYSCGAKGVEMRPYRIHKGSFKDDPNEHMGPRFGFIQMQRFGNRQHPTELQFNLEADYFSDRKIPYGPR